MPRTTARRPPWTALWLLSFFALFFAVAQSQNATASPLALSLTRRTGGALYVQWTATNVTDNISNYGVLVNGSLVANVPSWVTTYSAYGLVADTLYNLTVQGNLLIADANGSMTITSNPLLTKTLNATTPNMPGAVQLVSAGGGFLRVRVPLPLDTGGVNLSTIVLSTRSQVDLSWMTFSSVASEPEFTLYGLMAKTAYSVRAYVANAAGLYSPQSYAVYFETAQAQNPGPCPAPTVLNVTGGSIGVQLNPPLDGGGAPVRGYVVYMAVNGSGVFEEVANTVMTDQFYAVDIRRLPGQPTKPLIPRTQYDIKAVAINMVEMCVNPSSVGNLTGNVSTVWTTDASLPEAPPQPYFLSASGGHISIQLLMPGNMRGANLTGFSIMVNGSVHGSITASDERSFDILPLLSLSNYSIQVAVTTDVGVSDWSPEVIMSTSSPSAPSAPGNVSVTGISSSQATISWTLPWNSGGTAISDYRLVIISSRGSQTVLTGGAVKYQLNTLLANSAYTVKVVAINSAGRESTTTRIQGVTFQTLAPTPPSEPRGVRSVSSTGAVLEISWQASDVSGGVSFEDLLYNATLFPVGSCFNRSSSNQSVCQACNLVRVPAANEQYNITYSGQYCVQPSIPACPDGTSGCCVTPSNGSFASGLLCSRIAGQGRSRIVSGGSTLTSFEGLNPSSTYFAGVEAVNALGRSKTSPIVALQTRAQTAPGYPSNIRQMNATGGSVMLSWSPPLDTGGTTIIGYNIYRDYRRLTPSPVYPPFADCGLVANSQYVYGVAAVNASRMEGAMGSILVTTPQVTLPTLITLVLTARTVSWMNVTVRTSCDTSGSSALSYQYVVRANTSVIASGFFACCSFLIPGLDAGLSYNVSVRVANEAGSLDWVTSEFSTTSGVPSTPQWQLQRSNSYSLVFSTMSATNPDREITAYDIVASRGGVVIHEETIYCDTFIGSGLRSCPETYRLGGLSPRMDYNLSTRAVGVRGASAWSMGNFSTSDEAAGVFKIATQDYSASSGDTVNVTVQRVNGTAGSANVSIDVLQPDSVVLRCDCQASIGCACGLHLQVSGALTSPGVLQFLDGQENQTVQISLWDDDDTAPQSLSVLLNLIGANVVTGTPSQTLIRVTPSQSNGFPCFIRSKSEVIENATQFKVNVIRVKGSSGPLSFDVETFDISSIAFKHYLPLSATVTMSDRQSLASFSIRLIDNSYYDSTRVFGIRLRDRNISSTARAISQQSVITRRVVIIDDEDPSMLLPGTPQGINLVRVTGGELDFSWLPPNSSNSSTATVGGYVFRASTPSNGTVVSSMFNISALPSFILSSLESRKLYLVQVAAWNVYGMSEFSDVFLAMTTSPTPPSEPEDFHVLVAGSSMLTLAWSAPRDTGGEDVSKYVLSMRGEDGIFRPLVSLSVPVTTYTVASLSALTQYEFVIVATTDAYPVPGDNSSSTYLAARTSDPTVAEKPPPPDLMRPAAGGSLTFLIREPADLGGLPISDYSLYLRKAPIFDDDGVLVNGSVPVDEPFRVVCSDATPWANDSSARSCTVYKLLAATSYEAYVVLYNDMGSSPPSDRTILRTKSTIDLPSPPDNFGPSRVTAGNIYLSWELPVDLGGAADVLGYTVFQKTDAYFSNEFFTVYDGRDSTTRELAVKGLSRNTPYAFAVVAQNAVSYCVNLAAQRVSQFLTVTTLSYSQISPPQSLRQLSASGGMIKIAWDDPDDLAGVYLSGYTVELILYGDGASALSIPLGSLVGNIKTFSHSGLAELTTYRYAIRALNQDGPSERSVFMAFTTTACTAPTNVLNTQFIGGTGGHVAISWTPPEDTGGRPIIYYQVSRTDRPDAVYTTTSLDFTDSNGLTANTQYVYIVRAFNELYMGDPNYIWTATGNPSLPESALLTGVVSFGGRIEVNWTSPQDTGGIPIVAFVATLLDASGGTVIESYHGIDPSHTFTSLNATSSYQLSLQAVNDVGPGPTGEYSVYTGPVDLPSAPPAPTASAILGGSMNLTVYPPTYNGGEWVTLSLHNGSSIVYTFAEGETSVAMKNLVALTMYRFHVVASNSRGDTSGDALAVSTGAISQPSNVEFVELVGTSFDRLIVAWPPVQDTGGDVLLQYVVSYFQSDSAGVILPTSQVVQVTTSSLNGTLLHLEHTSNYSISIYAVTSSGLVGDTCPSAVFTTEEPFQGRMTAQFAEVAVREDTAVVLIDVLRVEGSFGDIVYSYSTADESALAGTNYEAAIGTLTMVSGVKTGTIAITLINDATYDPNMTFVVIITDGPTGRETLTRVVLLDDGDAGFISFAQPQFAFPESAGTVYLPITRYGGTSPMAIIEVFVVATQAALDNRFTLQEQVVTFNEGDAQYDLGIVFQDDSTFQFWPDSISLGFRILLGGVWAGDYTSANVTALDDGDVSPAKETSVKLVAVTGGSVQLQWFPPVDRGGTDVVLSYSVGFATTENVVVLNTTTPTNSVVVYNLNALTTYQVVVFPINPAGLGLVSNPALISTTKATPPTAPLNVILIAASSSSLLLTWDPPLDAGGSPVIGHKIYNVSSNGTATPFSAVVCTTSNICSVQRLVALTIYFIQVRAFTVSVSTGGVFSDVAAFQTSNPDVPDPPPAANVTWFSAGAMTIKMFKPTNVGGSDVQMYRLFTRSALVDDFTQQYEGTADSFTVYRLERRTTYEIKYQVINTVGASAFGASAFQQTLERSLPSAPLNLVSVSATGGSIVLSWQEPLDIGGRPVSGYTVFVKSNVQTNATTSVADVVGYDGKGNPATQGVVYGLNASTTYSMYVIAYSEVSNCYSPTDLAASTTALLATTVATLPVPAPTLLLVRYTGGIVELTWTPPIDAGGVPIDSYTLSLVSPTGTVPIFTTPGSSRLSFIHNDLIESTVYTYMVKANTTVGDSPMSDPVVVKTQIATAPSAPVNLLQLSYVTGGAIQIGWTRPLDTGGQPLKGYWVYRDGVSVAQNLPANTSNFTDKQNLRAATSYQYTIRAFSWSTMGSELSAPLTAKTTAATRPQLPVLLMNLTGASFIQVNWTADPDTGGMPVSLFDVKFVQGTSMAGAYTGIDSSFRFTRLLALTTYTLQIVAYSQVGASDMLSTVFTTLNVTLPAAPVAPLAISVFGGNMTIEVSAPVDTGGAPVSELRLYESKLGMLGSAPLVAGALKAQFPVYGLLKLTAYAITARAVNVLGEGGSSPVLTVQTGTASIPGLIRLAPVLTGATGSTLSVAWTATVDTGGDATLSYEVRFLENGTSTSIVSLSASRTLQGTGLKFLTTYVVSVRAINTAGKSDWSASLTAATLPDAAGEFNFATTAVNVSESAGGVVLTVIRTNGLSGSVAIEFSVSSSGTNAATIGKDLALVSGSAATTSATITFSALQVTASLPIQIINDDVYEAPDEQFTVRITSAKVVGTSLVIAPNIGVNSTTVVTIQDDGDAGYVGFANAVYPVREDGVWLDIPVLRQGGKSGLIVLSVILADVTATGDRDYRRAPGLTVSMADGQTTTTIRVFIINDKTYEYPDEIFMVQVVPLSGGALTKRPLTTVVIMDDGDLSVAAAPSTPVVLGTSGGGVTMGVGLPAHNGSAKGQLMGYVVRILNPATGDQYFNTTVALASTATVGWLTAQTSYGASVAAINAAGLGPFSAAVWFTTTVPTLPAPVVSISQTGSTGGSLTLKWVAPSDTGGVPITKYRIYSISPTNVPKLILEIPFPLLKGDVLSLNALTTYRFAVQAGNDVLVPELAHGWGVIGPPSSFTTPAATLAAATTISKDPYLPSTGGSITIQWTAPLDTGGVPLLRYDVYARNATTGFKLTAQAMQPISQSVRIEELYASSWYEIFVLSINNVSETPLHGQFSCSRGSNALVTSQDVSKNVSSGAVIRAAGAVFVVGDMSRATKGTLPLTAAYMGPSVLKVSASVMGAATSFANLSTTQASIPRVPPKVTLINATGGAISFQVESPGDTGGVLIDDFTVLVDGNEPEDDVVQKRSNMTSMLKRTMVMRVSNLEPLANHEITAVAVNSISLCDFNKKDTSEPAEFQTTNISQPEPPRIATQTVSGGGMVLALLDPFDKGGSPIMRYQLYMATDLTKGDWKRIYVTYAANDSEVTRQSATVASLKPVTKYFFMLSVNNGYFESSNSSVATIATSSISPPGQCTEPRLVDASGGMLSIAWDDPLDNGGAPVIDFLITLQAARSGAGSAASKRTINSWKARNYTFYGLTDETDYVVAIRARNLKGLGVDGIAATLSTTEGSPPLGAIGVTVLSSTGGAAIISFNEPIDFGGTPRESMIYSVYVEGVLMRTLKYSDVAAAVSTSTTKSRRLSAASGISIGGLDPLGLYSIQIQPMNDFDSGTVSQASLAATTAPTLPSAPQSLTASTVTGGSIQLKWKAPSDSGGLPLLEYVVYMSVNNQTGPFDVQCREAITSCHISSLTAATSYWFYVTASNALGESPATTVLNVATASISLPTAPGKARVVSVSENTIEVTWSPPLDTGGANITTYTVVVDDESQGSVLAPLTSSTPSATISGLSPTIKYTITVTATNQLQRVSAESMPQIVTTASAANTPAEPVVSCVSPTTVSLSWFPYPGATAYRVYQDGTEVYSGSATDMIDIGLTSGSDYSYTLEAEVNGVWSGTTSLPVGAHTSDDASSTETTCSSTRGHIQQTSYEPNVDKSWLVTPTTVFQTLTIEFTSFDLECDHDVLTIEDANDDSVLWQGGCQRSGTFVYQSKTPVRLRLHSDASVQKSGFDLYFETDRLRVEDVPTRIAAPRGGNGAICSSHGIRQNAGSCRCSVGFTGEACNNYIVCCSDPARCSNPVCSRDPSQVILVSDEFGDDAYGTGEMMDTSDDGKSSKAVKTLSKALSLAKDGDFVFVYPGEYKGALNRELQMNSRKDLTIESLKGFAWTTLNCEGAGRAMQLTSSSVTMQGFTIRNGSTIAADSDGGSIFATDSNLTLQDVLVTQSSATRSGGAIAGIRSNVTAIATSVEKGNATAGGGVYLVDSQLSLVQSNVTMCTATNGAGLLTEGSTAVSGGENAVILNNLASVDGGGVLIRSGALTLKDLKISANQAARGGGVLAQDSSVLVMNGCRVLQNKVSTDGGGMAIVGTVTVSGNGTAFEHNSAVGGGGGVHVRGPVSIAFDMSDTGKIQVRLQNNRAANGSGLCVVDSTLSLSGLSIQNGTASENGGGICVDDSRVTLTNVSVSSNVAASLGGGIFVANSDIVSQGAVVVDLNDAAIHGGGMFLHNANVDGNVHLLENAAAQRGGGWYVNGVSTLLNLTVEACSADQGGGGYLQQATVTATNVNVTNCTATTSGGGLHMNGSSLTVVQSVIDRGSAVFGGGVYAVNGSSIAGDLVILRSIASENGGALFGTDQLTLSSIVMSNSAAKRGAGMYTESAVAIVTDVIVSSCYATLEGGGWSATSSSLTLTNVRVEDGTSDNVGGAMALTDCSVVHSNVTVVGNQAKTGGGLYLVTSDFTGTPLSPDATAYTSTIANNTAQDHGGNVHVEDKVAMSALLITGGNSGISGGGVALRHANATISQCVIQGNTADERGGGLSLRDQSSCDLGISLVNKNAAKTSGGAVSIEDSIFTHNNLELHENRAFNGGGFALAGIASIRQFSGSDGSLLNASQAMQLPDLVGNGSAFYVSQQSSVDIAGMYVYQGLAGTGGLFVDTANVTMERCQFVYNNANVGGALFANPESVVSVVSSQFYSNRASKSGGAVQLIGNDDNDAVASFEDCEFTDNYAEQVGGAMAVAFADLTLLRTRFQTNTIGSKDGGGGAIGSTTQGKLNIMDCAFGNNTVQSENAKGGSLYLLADTNVTITRTALISDKSSILVREGGVVYVGGKGSELEMVDCEIAYGQSYSGGSIFVQEATLSLVRTVLREGYAYEFGGSLYMDSGVAEIVDCDINDNDAFYDGGGIYIKGKSTLTIYNTTIENNRVQDGGAGLYVAPGGGASVNISDSSFVMNRNRGLGSAIYVGRKNTLTMTSSELLGNGGANTEGGGLYAVDAQVTVSLSTFLGNRAVRGAAIELSRDAQLTMTNSDFADNQVTVWGGAIYMSVRAIATIEDSSFRNNSAVTGGVAYLLGSSKLTLRRSNVTANNGLSFGGAFTLIGRARAEIDRSVLTLNRAYTGGAISVTQNASLVLTSSQLAGNTANDFGGGVYIDTLMTTASQSIQVQSLSTRDNAARAGPDVYWVYHAWYEFSCASCASSSSSSGKIRVATSPASISAGWWPTTATSGVSLGITKHSWKSPATTPAPTSTNATTAPTTSPGTVPSSGTTAAPPPPGNRRLTVSSSSSSSSDATGTIDAMTLASIIANPDLTSPFEGTLWPTIVVKDFYGAVADQDNRTRCVATKVLNETDDFDFYPASAVDVERGYVTFTDGQVLSESRPTPFGVFVSCSLADDTARNLTVQIVVDNCNPGYENVEGRCVPCKKGTYSLDGVKCHLCPLGATCERMDATKTVIGVSVPTRAEGYFLYDSRDSYLDANCLDSSQWEDGDPCKRLVNVSEQVIRNMTYRLQHCSKNPTFDKYWSRKRVFACLAGLEYYACDTRDACIAEGASTSSTTTTVQAMSTSTIAQVPSLAASTNAKQCDVGYNSVTCATCMSSFYKVSNGKCKPCSDPHDPAVERMTRLVALVPVGFAIVAAILVWFYFANSSEREIMKQARAARKFQIYDPHSRPQALLLAAKFFVQQRVDEMIQRAKESLERRRRGQILFGIERRKVAIPAFRAEKFKILLAFFQIFGGFKKLYEIPWPNEMSRLMDIFTIADFSIVDTTGIECFIHKDYFSNYRLSLIAVIVLLFMTTLLLSWGVVRYRVKLAGLPRHCVRCGLPVFQMLKRQPKTLVRRSTMVSMLRIERKMHAERMRRRSFVSRAKDNVVSRADEWFSRAKAYWTNTRLGKILDRFVVFTRLPASCSEHHPSCPTSQEIESEVLAMVVRSNLRLWRARIRLRLNYQSFQNKCIKLFFWILLLFYPELSQRVVGMFYCDEVGSNFYMSRDKSQLCYEGMWLYYLPLTMFLLAVWVAGVPLLFWTIIFVKRRSGVEDQLLLLQDSSHAQLKQRFLKEMREDLIERGIHLEPDKFKMFEKEMLGEFLRNKKLNEPSMVAQVGFIYHSYRSEFWWFEVWDLCRKLFLNCVIGLLAKTGANRIIAGLIVFLIYLSVMLFYQPYKDRSDSALAGVTQIQLFITLFCGLMLKMGALHMEDSVVSLLTYVAFFSNVLTMIFAVCSILYEKFDGARRARRRVREDHRRAIQSRVRKLWRMAYGFAFTEGYLRDPSIRPMPVQVILELARRDREAKKQREMELQLARSLQVRDNEDDDEQLSSSQVEFDLPRPRDVVSPRAASSLSSSASFKQEKGGEHEPSLAIEATVENAGEEDNQMPSNPFTEDSQQLGDEGSDAVTGTVDT